MSDNALSELIAYLERVNAEVKRIEAEGETVLAEEGQDAFHACLKKKAELLAGLAEDCRDMVDRLGDDEVARRLRRFSASANVSLRFDSSFFMSALLYPEDYKSGDPNDLEVYIEALRARADG